MLLYKGEDGNNCVSREKSRIDVQHKVFAQQYKIRPLMQLESKIDNGKSVCMMTVFHFINAAY